MFGDLKRLFRHGGIYLAGNILNRLGAFVLLPLYTSHLSVAQYGVLELLYTTSAMFSVVFSAGLAHTTLRFFFDYTDKADQHAVVSTNLVVIMLLSTVGALGVHFVAVPLSGLLFDSPDFARAIDICLAIMVLELATEVGFAYLRAREMSLFYVWLSFARLAIQLLFSVYFVARLGMGVEGVLWANLASVILGALAVVGYALSQCGLTVRRALVPTMLRYSLPMAGSGIIGAVLLNVDRLLLKEMLSLDAVGIYALAVKFSLLLGFLVTEPFYRAYGPFRFSIQTQPNAAELQARVMHYLAAGATWVALGIALLMPEVLLFMATPAYEPASLFVGGLLLSGIAGAVGYCFETGLLVHKQTRYLFYASCANFVAKVGLSLVLIPVLGIQGAVVAHLAATLLRVAMINRASQRLQPIPYHWQPVMIILGLAGILFAAGQLVNFHRWQWSLPYKALLFAMFPMLLYFSDSACREAAGKLLAKLRARRRREEAV